MKQFEKYIRAFQRLRVDRSKGPLAPHKPILLLAVLDSILTGEISENKILITPELVARFKDSWPALVESNIFVPNFALPFYHLINDIFWFLQTKSGKEIILTSSFSVRSFKQLRDCVEYAYMDKNLFELMVQPGTNAILKQSLFETYFPLRKPVPLYQTTIPAITSQMLNDSPKAYREHTNLNDEEEIFIRGGVFKKLIPKIYGYACCITGLQIITDSNIQMIDACHIMPFNESHDDTIPNGISLCPNLHRAFDRRLVGITDDYRVIVSHSFKESEGHNYSIGQFNGKEILLPFNQSYYPSAENLMKHRRRWAL